MFNREEMQAIAAFEVTQLNEADTKVGQLINTMEGVKKLRRAGFVCSFLPNCYRWTSLEVTKEQLTDVRNALGATLEKDEVITPQDARKKDIIVCMKAKGYPFISIRYKDKLPKDAKCKLVRRKSSYITLECEV
jgi:hypothetical protein